MSFYKRSDLILLPHGGADKTVPMVKPTDGSNDFVFERDLSGNSKVTFINKNKYLQKEIDLTGMEDLQSSFWTEEGTGTLASSANEAIPGGRTVVLTDSSASSYYYLESNKIASFGDVTFKLYILKTVAVVYPGVDFINGMNTPNSLAIINSTTGTYNFTNGNPYDEFSVAEYNNDWLEVTAVVNITGPFSIKIYSSVSSNGTSVSLSPNGDSVAFSSFSVSGLFANLGADVPKIDWILGEPSYFFTDQNESGQPYTEDLSTSNYVPINSSINLSSVMGPDGITPTYELKSSVGISEQYMDVYNNSVGLNGFYVASCFVKSDTLNFATIRFTGVDRAFNAGSIWFDLANNVVGSIEDTINHRGIIVPIADGWKLIFAFAKATNTTASGRFRIQLSELDGVQSIVGDGIKSMYVFGVNFKQGLMPMPYVPAYGTNVISLAETVTTDQFNLGTEFTIVFETFVSLREGSNIIWFDDGSGNSLYFYMSANSIAAVSSQAVLGYSASIGADYGTKYKMAVTQSAGTIKLFINGALIDSGSSNISINTQLNVAKGVFLNKLLTFSDTNVLTDQECIDITTL